MLLTDNKTSNYLEALNYLSRMKEEDKCNETTIEIFILLFPKEIDILVSEGYFNPENN